VTSERDATLAAARGETPEAVAPDGHWTLRYMARFACIGPACEDNCCTGWRVDVDAKTYQALRAAGTYAAEDTRRRLQRAIVVTPAGRKQPERYSFKMLEDETCPLLEPDGMCHIHARLGPDLLPDVCKGYPRRLLRVGERFELTGHPSCPEVTRLLLTAADAVDSVALDPATLPLLKPAVTLDPRDVRPVWRLMDESRRFMTALLRKREHPLDHRLFFMLWFAKRTAAILTRDRLDGDLDAVVAEARLLQSEAALGEIGRRFDQVETPAALVLLLARQLVAPATHSRARANFRALVKPVFDSYARLGRLAALDEGGAGVAPPGPAPSASAIWREYRLRRDRVMARLGERVERYVENFCVHYWWHWLPMDAPDVMGFTLRLLTELAVQKFLLFSHPEVQGALADAALDDAAVGEVLDRVAVRVFQRTARFIEHGQLNKLLAKVLADRQLDSLAGGVYLVRF
jgi:lysine-N-methylase